MSSTSRFSQISCFIPRLFSSTISHNNSICTPLMRRTPKKCKKKTPYMICEPEVAEFPEILKIMEANYFREEPTLKFLGLKFNKTLATRIMDRLHEGDSLVAKCKYTGRILGAALNRTLKPWDSQRLAKLAEKQKCPKTKQLLMFYAYLEAAPRLFDKHSCLFEIFSTTNVFLTKAERNYGLGSLLTKRCIHRAIEKKYKLLRCNATTYAFSQILEKLKFNLEMTIPYESYVDETGAKIFKNVQVPNIGVRIYTLDISRMKNYHDD